MKNLKIILHSRTFYFILILLIIVVITLNFLIPKKSVYHRDIKELDGKVITFKIDGDLLSFVVQAKEKIQCFYYLKSVEEKNYLETHFGYGTEVNVIGNLERPKSNTIPNTFDYQKYLYYHNIYYLFQIDEIKIVNEASGINWIKNQITQKLQSYPYSEYLLSLVLGNQNYLDTTNISKNGISHLFAISGMHISILVAILSHLFQRFGSKTNYLITAFLLFYLYLVGFTPSVMRASFFFLGNLLNKKLRLSLSKKQVFFLVLCIVILINPYSIMNLGFQYSFLISYCLLDFKSSRNYFINLLRISLLSFLLSLPITAMNFFSINLLSIIWNLFFVPFVSFLLYPCCLIYLLFPFLAPLFAVLITIFEGINEWCSGITFGILIIPKVSFFFWVSYFFLLYLFLKTKKKRYCVILLLTLMVVKNYPKFNPYAYVYFIDVGQGDSTLFLSPHQQEIILIDTGGKMNINKKDWQQRYKVKDQVETLKTFFHSLGITSIHYLVITHGDIDHGGNALSLLESMEVEKIILNNNATNDLEKKICVRYSDKIEKTILSSFFEIYDLSQIAQNENDSSLIYRVTVFGRKFLMMGDASSSVETTLLNKNIGSDILKVGHHGSKTSSSMSFLKKVNPAMAIISVGENNLYGHPSKETISRLNTQKIPFLLTSEEGTIWFEISEKAMKIHSIKQDS